MMIVLAPLLIIALLFAGISLNLTRASPLTSQPPSAQLVEFYKLGIEIQSLVNRGDDLEKVANHFGMDDESRQKYLTEWEEAAGMNTSVMFLAHCTSELHLTLKQFFDGDSNSDDVEYGIVRVIEMLDDGYGFQALIDQQMNAVKEEENVEQQQQQYHHYDYENISADDEEKQAIEEIAKKMAEGKVCLRSGKLTMGPANHHEAQEVMDQEVVELLGKTFLFYFAKDEMKSEKILGQHQFHKLLSYFVQQLKAYPLKASEKKTLMSRSMKRTMKSHNFLDGNDKAAQRDQFEQLSISIKLTTEDQFKELSKKLTTEVEKGLKHKDQRDLKETSEMDARVFRLAVYNKYLYDALKRFFDGENRSSDVELKFTMVKQWLNKKFGLQELLIKLSKSTNGREGEQQQHNQHHASAGKMSADEEKKAFEAVAIKMAEGKVFLKVGAKLTMGMKASGYDPEEVKYGEVVKMVGQTLHFYFGIDQMKSHQRYSFQHRKEQQAQETTALKTLLNTSLELDNFLDEKGKEPTPQRKTEIDRKFNQIVTQLQILKPKDETEKLEIDWEFALEMALGNYPKEEQKQTFDNLLDNSSTELFQVIGKILMEYFHNDWVNHMKKESS